MANAIRYSKWFAVSAAVVITGVTYFQGTRTPYNAIRVEDEAELSSHAAELSVAYQFSTTNKTYTITEWPNWDMLYDISHTNENYRKQEKVVITNITSVISYDTNNIPSVSNRVESIVTNTYYTRFLGPSTNYWEISDPLYQTNSWKQPVLGTVIYWSFLYENLMKPIKNYYKPNFYDWNHNAHAGFDYIYPWADKKEVWWLEDSLSFVSAAEGVGNEIGSRSYSYTNKVAFEVSPSRLGIVSVINHPSYIYDLLALIPGLDSEKVQEQRNWILTNGIATVKFLTTDTFSTKESSPSLHAPQINEYPEILPTNFTGNSSFYPCVQIPFKDPLIPDYHDVSVYWYGDKWPYDDGVYSGNSNILISVDPISLFGGTGSLWSVKNISTNLFFYPSAESVKEYSVTNYNFSNYQEDTSIEFAEMLRDIYAGFLGEMNPNVYTFLTNGTVYNSTNNIFVGYQIQTNAFLSTVLKSIAQTAQIYYDKTLWTNKLNDTQKALKDLNQSLVIRTVDNIIPYSDTKLITTSYQRVCSTSYSPWDMTSWENLLAQYDSLSTTITTNSLSVANASPWSYQLLSGYELIQPELVGYNGKSIVGVVTNTYSGTSSALGMSRLGNYIDLTDSLTWKSAYKKIQNASFDYPSLWAITNGYVSRVRIYASAYCEEPTPIDTKPFIPTSSGTNSYLFGIINQGIYTSFYSRVSSPDLSLPNSFEGETFGTEIVSGTPIFLNTKELPVGFVRNSSDMDFYDRAKALPFSKVKANKILDVVNPTARISFNLGNDGIEPTETVLQEETTQITETGYSYREENFGNEKYYMWYDPIVRTLKSKITDQKIYLDKFYIVVDWNWEHMQDDKYVPPTNNNPGWLIPYTGTVTNYFRRSTNGIPTKLP